MIHRKFWTLLACSSVVVMSCLGTQAQQDSIGVMPASVDTPVKRGVAYVQTFTLSNNTGKPLRFRCSVEDVWYAENNKRVTGRPGTLPRSASMWVQFAPAEVVIEPHTFAVVKAIVTVPIDAAGGYYTVPVFEAMPAQAIDDGSMTRASTATASIRVRFRGLMMLTTVEGSEYNVEIAGGQVLPSSASSELVIQLDVRNRSTAHARVRGVFAILNASGAVAGRGAIQEKKFLPGQQSNLRAGWAGQLPPGNYTSIITLSYGRVGLEPGTVIYELPVVIP